MGESSLSKTRFLMKIGILTYHRSHNYGALLQAVALRIALSSLGHQVFYIDYFPEYHRRMYAIFDKEKFVKISSFKKRVKYCISICLTFVPKLIRRISFNRFIKKHINPYCRPEAEEFDLIVYGSDQIWRKQPFLGQYNPMYFGSNSLFAKHHVSYAASLDVLPTKEDDIKTFLHLPKPLETISVREEQTRSFFERNGFTNVRIDLDPTLLLSPTEWSKIIPEKRIIKERYVLFYDLQSDASSPTFDEKEVNAFAQRNKCRLIRIRAVASRIGSRFDRHHDSPDSFINLIRFSECIITSAFHGVAFSIVFNRPFLCRFSNSSARAVSLLHQLGLESCLIDNTHPIIGLISEIQVVSPEIVQLNKEKSLHYLAQL